MDTINNIVARKGLLNEPALAGLNYSIHPMPCVDGCPLGLYDPRTRSIVLPEDFTEPTLLHEFGHAFGHYHFNDLSERFAERFRKAHMKGSSRVMLAAGGPEDFYSLARYEPLFEEGERGAVEMHFDYLPQETAQSISSKLLSQPESELLCLRCGPSFYRVEFTKGQLWMEIVVIAVLGVIALGLASSLGFGLFKIQEKIAQSIIPMTLIVGGIFITYSLMKEKAR